MECNLGRGRHDRFATTVASSGLWFVSANGGIPAQLTTPEADVAHGYPQILPGGTELLYRVRQRNTWQLALMTLKDRVATAGQRSCRRGGSAVSPHRPCRLLAGRRAGGVAIQSLGRQSRSTSDRAS